MAHLTPYRKTEGPEPEFDPGLFLVLLGFILFMAVWVWLGGLLLNWLDPRYL